MLTPPELEDPRQYDYEYGDQEEMIYKKNALNAYHYNFYNALKVIVGELNVEFQFVADSRLDITNKSGQVATALQQVNTAKQSVDQSKNHIDQQKQAIDTTAGQVSQNAQQVASDKQVVAQDKQAAAASAQAAGESAGQAEQSKQAAQDLYQDLDAVNTAKTQSQQAAQTATEQAGLAESSAATATEQAGIATQAAQNANVDINAAIQTHAASGDHDARYMGWNKEPLGRLVVHDVRGLPDSGGASDYLPAPVDMPDRSLNLFFSQEPAGNSWRTALVAKAWSSNYDAWMLSGPAYSLGGDEDFYLRSGAGSTWGPDRRIMVEGLERDGSNLTGNAPLRARGTTKEDVGLPAVDNYSRAHYDTRYARIEVANVFAGDLEVSKDNPWLTLDSPAGGEIGVEQCAGISIGESGKKGVAALHLTYTGDGRGHIGMGVVDVATGIPENEVMELYYQSKDVKFLGGLTLPDGVRLDGITNGLKITNNANGYVEIGNRNSGHTHYTSSNGSHYFYGVLRVAEGFQGDGSGVTNVNATKLGGQSRSEYDDANTVAGRTSAGDLRARLFRSTYTSTNSNIAVIYTAAKSDGTDFMRPSTPAQVRAALDLDDLGAITGSNSRGRYYLYPDGRLVMQCGVKTFTQDPSSYRYLLCKVTLPYTPLGSAEHYVTATPSSDASDYSSGASPLDVAPPLAKPGRVSSGTVVEVRVANISKSNHSSGATAKASILVESRWK